VFACNEIANGNVNRTRHADTIFTISKSPHLFGRSCAATRLSGRPEWLNSKLRLRNIVSKSGPRKVVQTYRLTAVPYSHLTRASILTLNPISRLLHPILALM